MISRDLFSEVFHGIKAAADRISHPGKLFVAYSGGVDSHVLLHLLAGNRNKLPFAAIEALHVDHGLQAQSKEWALYCRQICRDLDVPYRCIVITETCKSGHSRESWARDVRYKALAKRLAPGDILVTAHHRDDQTETFILNAMRGSGPHGLSAISSLRRLGHGWLSRPMLALNRAAIESYARHHGLDWIDDTTNADVRFDRNFVRLSVMPLLESRWGSVSKTVSRVVELQQEAAQVLDAYADDILQSAGCGTAGRLPVSVLSELRPEVRRLVVRRWIKVNGFPIPDLVHINSIEACVLDARAGAQACVHWKGAVLRRYRGQLYLMPKLAPVPDDFVKQWDLKTTLPLSWGTLATTAVTGEGLSQIALNAAAVTVQLRRGGERCHPVGRQHSQTLKRLFQEWGVPPWERGRVPLIFADRKLAAVGSICICNPFGAKPDEVGRKIRWRPGY